MPEYPVNHMSPIDVKHDQLCALHSEDIKNLKELTRDLPVFSNKLDMLISDVGEIKTKLDDRFVTKEKFDDTVGLLQRIVFGFISLIIVGVVSGWLSTILKP